MNNEKLLKNINQLKNIEPETDFVLSTRRIVLASKQNNYPKLSLWIWGFSFSLILLAFISANLFYAPQPNTPSLAYDEIREELEGLDIQLQEIEYNQNIDTTIAYALSEISRTQANHLNPTILEMESDVLNQNEDTNGNIDEMLDSIIN